MDESRELVVRPKQVRLVACPRPFSVDRVDMRRPAGGTVADHMAAIGIDPDRVFARVFIDDRMIPTAEWERAKPAAGELLTIRVIPTGGQAEGKDVMRTVALIAVMVIAVAITQGGVASLLGPAFQAGALGAQIGGSVFAIGASLAVNGLIPPTLPRRPARAQLYMPCNTSRDTTVAA
ncbi:hypothetical protein [Nitrospira moscoviensis]|uniref:Uncharacterized protein n=1 Tax=Nitrospira moscoviensis TaxID=42253 RepID=A0A0K2GGW4_NITMO|nr:hypothetical protein [Nitrospira moscoviensis]ALA60200.1 hypothetical protein NITMOv2_3810 [Nitrospira moscoviensis]